MLHHRVLPTLKAHPTSVSMLAPVQLLETLLVARLVEGGEGGAGGGGGGVGVGGDDCVVGGLQGRA